MTATQTDDSGPYDFGATLEVGSLSTNQSLTEIVGMFLTPVLVAALIAVSFLLGRVTKTDDGPTKAIMVEVPTATTVRVP